MKRTCLFLALAALALACQLSPTPPPLEPTPVDWVARQATLDAATKQAVQGIWATATPPGVAPITPAPGELRPFPALPGGLFAPAEPVIWEPVDQGAGVELPVVLDQIANRAVLAGLSLSQRDHLSRYGFVIVHSKEAQFLDIRRRVSLYYGQPYYLTTDAAYHALHLSYDKLLEAVEREELRPRMAAITQAVFNELLVNLPLVEGSTIEGDARLAAAYMGVALRLFNPQAEIPAELEALVAGQVAQILAAEENAESVLLPGFQDDYRVYRPQGHYTRDGELQSYYRAMTWFSRMVFSADNARTSVAPSRVPLIITMALRRANLPQGPAAQEWTAVEGVLNFLLGMNDDAGPREYAALMDRVYGQGVTILGLKDEGYWQVFQALSAELPPPQANPAFAEYVGTLPNERGWRFIGQRFALDAFVLHNLVYDRVGEAGNKRLLPSGLDVVAALGSPAAQALSEQTGAAAYRNYAEQLAKLQAAVQAHRQEQWLSAAYNIWMYTFTSQLDFKGQGYPPYMLSQPWMFKEMNTVLGSWAELKHSAAWSLDAVQTMDIEARPASPPAPGFVEPAPDVFYRLAYLCSVIAEGLEQRGFRGGERDDPSSLTFSLDGMRSLATHYQKLGDLADKELVGLPLDAADYALVQAPLGPFESLVESSRLLSVLGGGRAAEMPLVPAIKPLAGAVDQLLHVGVGLVDRIYVVVAIDGGLHVAQGGVYSYYEFTQPSVEPLDDLRWNQVIQAAPEFPLPAWSSSYVLLEGIPVNVLAWRAGDVYRITSAGGRLNLRASHSLATEVVVQLQAGDYVKILAGPVSAQNYTWWKVQIMNTETLLEGWVVENPEWFERAWGQ